MVDGWLLLVFCCWLLVGCLVWFGLAWFGLVCFGLVCFGLVGWLVGCCCCLGGWVGGWVAW